MTDSEKATRHNESRILGINGVPVKINDISKSYGTFPVLQSIRLNIEPGEFLTMLGPSGSGKTTLLMVIAGFVRPDNGSLQIGNVEAIRSPPHKRNVGMVFQSYALFPHMDVFANVAFPLSIRGVAREETRRRVEVALAQVRLSGYAQRRIDQLSGGQRQRVALARAVVFGPKILLMDEPLSALDKKLREEMQIEIRQIHQDLGMTTIYVTHDQREALTMSDRIAVMDQGTIVQVDTPGALYRMPKNRFVAEFVGESTLLPVSVSHDGSDVSFGGQRLKIARRNISKPLPRSMLLIRPEHVRMARHPTGESGTDTNCFAGTVSHKLFQGDQLLLRVTLAGGQDVLVREPARHTAAGNSLEVGEKVSLLLDREDSILVPGSEL
ncbi:ABC transporter ATP-binding protein [Mesorhizobium sp.]|uniref:ABC transporter ATP-binding protein n=1 Tax=Mesorhizobium sp. TaxID=1871066 RepID=UPI000FE9F404|nr:ABC transporter ATP-binding protein [Mesorhizobium sp.]RWP55879.1 MAG: ABC transporter ATP-binding protein [Mesorhizobium sp.]